MDTSNSIKESFSINWISTSLVVPPLISVVVWIILCLTDSLPSNKKDFIYYVHIWYQIVMVGIPLSLCLSKPQTSFIKLPIPNYSLKKYLIIVPISILVVILLMAVSAFYPINVLESRRFGLSFFNSYTPIFITTNYAQYWALGAVLRQLIIVRNELTLL